MADDNKLSVVKDVRPGIKNLNLVFIVIDVGKFFWNLMDLKLWHKKEMLNTPIKLVVSPSNCSAYVVVVTASFIHTVKDFDEKNHHAS